MPEPRLPPSIFLRPIEPADEDFLRRLYASTRTAELSQVPWSETQKEQFLRMQFDAQAQHYRTHYAGASFDVIVRGEQRLGRLYVHRQPHDIRIVDITLAPEHRNQGLGEALLRALMAEAGAAGSRLSIHVEIFNPARALYERLGFREAADRGVYKLMEWRAEAP